MTKNRESSDPYYDLFEDWDLIVSSFLSQYGIRIQTKEFETVSWDEFVSLLSGIGQDTVLGRVAAIRSETNEAIIKRYSVDQRRIYEEWRDKKARKMTPEVYEKEMKNLENMMASLFG